jgi:hypothetical protein
MQYRTSFKQVTKALAAIMLSILVARPAEAQLQRKQWLAGGRVGFVSSKALTSVGNSKSTTATINGDVAYFVEERFAVGVRPDINFSWFRSIDGQRQHAFEAFVGPFIRYFYLSRQANLNLFAESGYLAGLESSSNLPSTHRHIFFIGTGDEIFVNRSVGIILSVEYAMTRSNVKIYSAINDIQVQAGFQFHFH